MFVPILYFLYYLLLCSLWTFFSQEGLNTSSDVVVNTATQLLIVSYINQLYITMSMPSRKRSKFESLWMFLPMLLIALSILERLSLEQTMILIGAVLLFGLLKLYFSAKVKGFIIPILLIAILLGYKGWSLGMSILSFLAIILDTQFTLGYKGFGKLELLPQSGKYQTVLLVVFILFFTGIIYFLGLQSLGINIIIILLLLGYSLFLVINMELARRLKEDSGSFYFLAPYIMAERQEFSSILHDEIIQDLVASKQLLELKKPDYEKVIEILENLEDKSRKVMNLYSSSIFLDYDICDNLNQMILSLKSLYPQRELKIKTKIEDGLSLEDHPSVYKLTLQSLKELLTNVFKHSLTDEVYIHIHKDVNHHLQLSLRSNRAREEDLLNIESSRRGVLMLKALIKREGGKIYYELQEEKLITTILLPWEK